MKLIALVFSALLVLGCNAERAANNPEKVRSGGMQEHGPHSSGRNDEKGLSLYLAAAKRTFSNGEPVEVIFSIENHDKIYWAFFPTFSPEGQSSESGPVAELSFLILHESGIQIPWTGQYEGLREPPPLCAAEILMPSAFCGSHVSLTEGVFAHALREPGLYKVKARLRLYQTAWMKSRLQQTRVDPAELPYDARRVFDGVLESNEIEIKLQPQ